MPFQVLLLGWSPILQPGVLRPPMTVHICIIWLTGALLHNCSITHPGHVLQMCLGQLSGAVQGLGGCILVLPHQRPFTVCICCFSKQQQTDCAYTSWPQVAGAVCCCYRRGQGHS